MAARNDDGWFLKDDWTIAYYKEFMWGASAEDTVKEWLKGTQWILNYYTGSKPVDYLWYYPWYLPPLFRDICVDDAAFACTAVTLPNPIQPMTQLIMVLPVESYGLLPKNLRRLPYLRPEYYPKTWTFFSAGRRQLWECEPMIPMLPYHIVQKLVAVEF
jgi:5'-3' exonuclease